MSETLVSANIECCIEQEWRIYNFICFLLLELTLNLGYGMSHKNRSYNRMSDINWAEIFMLGVFGEHDIPKMKIWLKTSSNINICIDCRKCCILLIG